MSARSSLSDGLHYSDGRHRWIAPPSIEQDRWDATMRAHLDQHAGSRDPAGAGGSLPAPVRDPVPATPERPPARGSIPRMPRTRGMQS